MLNKSIQNKIVEFITSQWKALPLNSKPWGFWIRHYLTIPFNSEYKFYGDPVAVYFFSENRLVEKNIWDWKRFETIHCIQPWCMKMYGEPYLMKASKIHEIGLTAFGEFENRNDFYIELIWGGLFGFGHQAFLNTENKIELERMLWIS